MLKLRAGILSALLLGTVTVVAAETWPSNVSAESLSLSQPPWNPENLQ